MSNRITRRDLETQLETLNRITGSPATPYTRDETTGELRANIGNFHLSGAYGGVCVHRMETDGGGITCPIFGGYLTKREAFEKLTAFIAGIEYTQRQHD